MNEGADVCILGGFPCVSIAPLCGVAKEWRVPHLGEGLPVHSPGSQGSPSMKPELKIQRRGGLVSDGSFVAILNGALSVSFLGEDPDWVITFRGESYHLGVLMRPMGVTFWNSTACIVLGVTPVTWYTHARAMLFLETLLLIQSPA